MKRKLLLVSGVALLWFFSFLGSAWALPFSSTGVVAPILNSDGLTGTATYTFTWDYTKYSVTEVDLRFQGNIFSNVTGPSGTVLSPEIYNGNTYNWLIHSPAGGVTQGPITLQVDYTLNSTLIQ